MVLVYDMLHHDHETRKARRCTEHPQSQTCWDSCWSFFARKLFVPSGRMPYLLSLLTNLWLEHGNFCIWNKMGVCRKNAFSMASGVCKNNPLQGSRSCTFDNERCVKIEVLVVENYPKRRNIKKHYQNRTRSPWHGTRICFPSCAKTIHWHLWRVTPQGEWESMKVEDVITSCKHASSVCRITDAQMPGAPPWQLQRKPKRRHSAQKTT